MRSYNRLLIVITLVIITCSVIASSLAQPQKNIKHNLKKRYIIKLKVADNFAHQAPQRKALRSSGYKSLRGSNYAPKNAGNLSVLKSKISQLGGKVDKELKNIRVMSVEADNEVLEELKKDPLVESITEDHILHATLDFSVPHIKADLAWNFSGDMHYNGSGQTVCIVDTGVNYSHPALGGCFGPGCKVIAGYDFINDDSDPMDDAGHGSNIAGVVISTDNTYKGVAPGSNLVMIKALNSEGNGFESDVLAGIDWCINHSYEYNITVISLSLGDSQEHDESSCRSYSTYNNFEELFSIANSLGISVVIASGNNGFTNGINFPACTPNSTAVGSSNNDDSISSFTDRGSLMDVLAPGVYIRSTSKDGISFVENSGTSLSTPHVAGAIALINQYHFEKNGFILNPSATKALLRQSGRWVYDSESNLSYPVIDVYAAFRRILSLNRTLNAAYNKYGRAFFNNNHELELSHACLNITNKKISYNSFICKVVELEINNLTYKKTPAVLINNSYCSNCSIISYVNNTLRFIPDSRSGVYTTTNNSKLNVSVNGELALRQINFSANYSKFGTNTLIYNASCRLFINNKSYSMSIKNNVYYYNLSFKEEGDYNFSVECNSSLYESLEYKGTLMIKNNPSLETLPHTITTTITNANPYNISFVLKNTGNIELHNISFSHNLILTPINPLYNWDNHSYTLEKLNAEINNSVLFIGKVNYTQAPMVNFTKIVAINSSEGANTLLTIITFILNNYSIKQTLTKEIIPGSGSVIWINLTNTGDGILKSISISYNYNSTLPNKWLNLSAVNKTYELLPNQTKNINIGINIPVSNSTGWYYTIFDINIPGFTKRSVVSNITVIKGQFNILPGSINITHTNKNPFNVSFTLNNTGRQTLHNITFSKKVTPLIIPANATFINQTLSMLRPNESAVFIQEVLYKETKEVNKLVTNEITCKEEITKTFKISIKLTNNLSSTPIPIQRLGYNQSNSFIINLSNIGNGPLHNINISYSTFNLTRYIPASWITPRSYLVNLSPGNSSSLRFNISIKNIYEAGNYSGRFLIKVNNTLFMDTILTTLIQTSDFEMAPLLNIINFTYSNPINTVIKINNTGNLSIYGLRFNSNSPNLLINSLFSNANLSWVNNTIMLLNPGETAILNISILYDQSDQVNKTYVLDAVSLSNISHSSTIITFFNLMLSNYSMGLTADPGNRINFSINISNIGNGPVTAIRGYFNNSSFSPLCNQVNNLTLIPAQAVSINCSLNIPNNTMAGEYILYYYLTAPGLSTRTIKVIINVSKSATYNIYAQKYYNNYIDISNTGKLLDLIFTNTGNTNLSLNFNLSATPLSEEALANTMLNFSGSAMPGENISASLYYTNISTPLINKIINYSIYYFNNELNISGCYNFSVLFTDIYGNYSNTTEVAPSLINNENKSKRINLWKFIRSNFSRARHAYAQIWIINNTLIHQKKLIFNRSNLNTTIFIEGGWARISLTNNSYQVILHNASAYKLGKPNFNPVSEYCNGSFNLTNFSWRGTVNKTAFCIRSKRTYAVIVENRTVKYYTVPLLFNTSASINPDILVNITILNISYKRNTEKVWVTSRKLKPINLDFIQYNHSIKPIIRLRLKNNWTYKDYSGNSLNLSIDDVLVNTSYSIIFNLTDYLLKFKDKTPSLLNQHIGFEQIPKQNIESGAKMLRGFAVEMEHDSGASITVHYNKSYASSLGYKKPRIALYKCEDWDSKYHECDSSWEFQRRYRLDNNYINYECSGFSAYALAVVESPTTDSDSKSSSSGGSGGGFYYVPDNSSSSNNNTNLTNGTKKTSEDISPKHINRNETLKELIIEPQSVKRTVNKGELAHFSLYLQNPNKKEIDVFLVKSGSINPIIFMPSTYINLAPDSNKSIMINISVNPSIQRTNFSGAIIIKYLNKTVTIPIWIGVVKKSQANNGFIKTTILNPLTYPGGEIKILLNYSLPDYSRNSTLLLMLTDGIRNQLELKKSVLLSGRGSKKITFKLDKDIDKGAYSAHLEVITPKHERKEAIEEKPLFIRVKPLWFVTFYKTWYLIVIALILVIVYLYLITNSHKKVNEEKYKIHLMPKQKITERKQDITPKSGSKGIFKAVLRPIISKHKLHTIKKEIITTKRCLIERRFHEANYHYRKIKNIYSELDKNSKQKIFPYIKKLVEMAKEIQSRSAESKIAQQSALNNKKNQDNKEITSTTKQQNSTSPFSALKQAPGKGSNNT